MTGAAGADRNGGAMASDDVTPGGEAGAADFGWAAGRAKGGSDEFGESPLHSGTVGIDELSASVPVSIFRLVSQASAMSSDVDESGVWFKYR